MGLVATLGLATFLAVLLQILRTASAQTYFTGNAFTPPGYIAKSTAADKSLCSRVDCLQHTSCLSCPFPVDCMYGEPVAINCTTLAPCAQQASVQRHGSCQYCWQTDETEHECEQVRNCSVTDVRLFTTTCRVAEHVVCMGRRVFYKNVRCRWTNGYSWSKTMLFSVTLGGFGVDRFYLGLWKSAIGKLFSFGGLGIWTIVDIVLIGVGYIGPADGSMYI